MCSLWLLFEVKKVVVVVVVVMGGGREGDAENNRA